MYPFKTFLWYLVKNLFICQQQPIKQMLWNLCIIRKSLPKPEREVLEERKWMASLSKDHVCMGVCVDQDLIDRKIKAHIWEPYFFRSSQVEGVWLQRLPEVWGAALKVRAGTPLSVCCLRWVLLVGHSLSNSVCSFHLQLSAALNVNYRGTLQLDISPFTLYLKQHAATSKSCGCLWCCKKKELQWSTKNQCNFLEPCFIHLLSLEVWSQSLEVQTAHL